MKSSFALLALLLSLSACGSLSEKATGLNGLDTITAEDKEQDAWYKSFYGSNHCGVSEGVCKPGEDE